MRPCRGVRGLWPRPRGSKGHRRGLGAWRSHRPAAGRGAGAGTGSRERPAARLCRPGRGEGGGPGRHRLRPDRSGRLGPVRPRAGDRGRGTVRARPPRLPAQRGAAKGAGGSSGRRGPGVRRGGVQRQGRAAGAWRIGPDGRLPRRRTGAEARASGEGCGRTIRPRPRLGLGQAAALSPRELGRRAPPRRGPGPARRHRSGSVPVGRHRGRCPRSCRLHGGR